VIKRFSGLGADEKLRPRISAGTCTSIEKITDLIVNQPTNQNAKHAAYNFSRRGSEKIA
jgi:hypothetical protein